MKKGKLLSLILAIVVLFNVIPMSMASAQVKASDPADWGDAKWIWGSSNPGTTVANNRNIVQYFRRDITLESVPNKAELMISADTKYWMWVNGEEVVWEGQLVRGPSGPSHSANSTGSGSSLKQQTSARNDSSYYDTIDIAQYLNEGKNTISIMVWHWNNTSTHNNPSRYGGLILASDLIDTTSLKAVSTGDGMWRTVKSPAHNTTVAPIGQAGLNPTPNVTYDASVDFDWKNPTYNRFVADDWESATTYGPVGGTDEFYGWGPLVERPILQWKDFGRFDLKAENKILFSSPTPHNPVSNPTLAKPEVLTGETNAQYYARVKAPTDMPQTMADLSNRFAFPTGFNATNSRWIVGVLPYNLQMVAWLELSEDTPAGQQIYVRSEPFNQSSTQNVFVTKAGAQLLEGVNWFNGEFLYFLVPNTITDDMILGLGSRETGHAFDGMRDTTSMATDTPEDIGGLRDFAGHFDSKVKSDDATITGVNVQGITAIPSGVTEMTFSGGHTWGNPSYKVNDEGATQDNNFYDELWKKAVRCMYVTMRDSYYDCPDRERGQYIGDAVNEFEETYYSLGPSGYDMIAKAFKEHANWQWEFNWAGSPDRTFYAMSNVRPGILTQEIYTQSLTAIYALNDYWKFVGDTDVIENNWQKYFNYLTNWELSTPANSANYSGNLRRTRPQGDPPGYSTLSDWCDWGNYQDKYAFYTVIYYLATKSVYDLGTDPSTGIAMTPEQKAFLEGRMGSIEQNFEKFWDPSVKSYRSTVGGSHDGQANWSQTSNNCGLDVDDRVNALAVVAGLVPESRYQDMRDLFMGGGVHTTPHENASIYLEKYVQEALYLMGYPEDAMYRMARRHIRIVNDKSWTSMPEHWGNYWYGTVSGQGTKNHGWSGGSMIAMSRRAAGVEPTSAGYGTWHVVPQMANFENIDCKVPAVIGDIDVLLDKDADTGDLTMSVTSPGNEAEIWVPVEAGKFAMQTAGAEADFIGIQEKYNNEYAVYKVETDGTYEFKTKMAALELANPAVTEYEANSPFNVLLTTAADASKVKLVNELGSTIGSSVVGITNNGDGSKTYKLSLQIGTPGERTISAMVMGQIGDYKATSAALDVKIVKASPVQNTDDIISATAPGSAGVNTPFTVTVVTSKDITKVKIVGETGASIGILSSGVVTNGNTKTWTISIKVGSKGNRTLTALGAGSTGGYGTDGKSFNITIQ